jgi:hypothetical protein
MRTVRLLTTRPVRSIAPKVSRWRVSEMAKVRYGGTKKKSKAHTLRIAPSNDGPRPWRLETAITASKYTMTRLGSSENGASSVSIAVASPTSATAST